MDRPSTPSEVDKSIIILSLLISTHPSIQIVNETFNSLASILDGLPVNTTKLLSVDIIKKYSVLTHKYFIYIKLYINKVSSFKNLGRFSIVDFLFVSEWIMRIKIKLRNCKSSSYDNCLFFATCLVSYVQYVSDLRMFVCFIGSACK